tara:strand:+ start:246 stop:674 length:429 start_codon:yes stop_codon:yes gene_type:complete
LKNNTQKLFEIVVKSIDKLGIKRTTQILETSIVLHKDNKHIVSSILINTCQTFNISEHILINGRKNIANRTNAIGVCCLLLTDILNLSQTEIGKILKKDVSNINKYLKKFKKLDENFKEEKIIIDKINLIKEITLENIKDNG